MGLWLRFLKGRLPEPHPQGVVLSGEALDAVLRFQQPLPQCLPLTVRLTARARALHSSLTRQKAMYFGHLAKQGHVM